MFLSAGRLTPAVSGAGPTPQHMQPERAPGVHSTAMVELSRYAASAFQHHSAYAILSQMAEAPICKSVVKQPLSGGILPLRADAVASRWTLSVKYGNISAIFLKGF